MLFKHREKPFYKAYKLAFCLVCLSFSVFAAPKAPGKTILHVTPNPGQVAEALAQISRAVEEKKPELLKNYLCGKIDFLSFLPQQTIKKSINVHELALIWVQPPPSRPPNPFRKPPAIQKRIRFWDITEKGEMRIRVQLSGSGSAIATGSQRHLKVPLIWDLIFKLDQKKACLVEVHLMPKDIYPKIIGPMLEKALTRANTQPKKVINAYTENIQKLPRAKTFPLLPTPNKENRLEPGSGVIRHGSLEVPTN